MSHLHGKSASIELTTSTRNAVDFITWQWTFYFLLKLLLIVRSNLIAERSIANWNDGGINCLAFIAIRTVYLNAQVANLFQLNIQFFCYSCCSPAFRPDTGLNLINHYSTNAYYIWSNAASVAVFFNYSIHVNCTVCQKLIIILSKSHKPMYIKYSWNFISILFAFLSSIWVSIVDHLLCIELLFTFNTCKRCVTSQNLYWMAHHLIPIWTRSTFTIEDRPPLQSIHCGHVLLKLSCESLLFLSCDYFYILCIFGSIWIFWYFTTSRIYIIILWTLMLVKSASISTLLSLIWQWLLIW